MSRLSSTIEAVRWDGTAVVIVDQRRLPGALVESRLTSLAQVKLAIATLAVRGAPAIGIAAAYGLAMACSQSEPTDPTAARNALMRDAEDLAAVRPTAANLRWAVLRVRDAALAKVGDTAAAMRAAAVTEAEAIHHEDRNACDLIGNHGADWLGSRTRILTHCNTGRLATGGIGTALGVVYTMAARGLRPAVLVGESRPLLQGARLTAFELTQANVNVMLITDSAAGHAMRTGRVDAVIVGCDRVAANGDVVNKIGTYQLAVLARENGIPMLVAGPLSSFDLTSPDGDSIAIEERTPPEVRAIGGTLAAPSDVPVWNPAFDMTPAAFVTALVTEAGVLLPPFQPAIAQAMGRQARKGSEHNPSLATSTGTIR